MYRKSMRRYLIVLAALVLAAMVPPPKIVKDPHPPKEAWVCYIRKGTPHVAECAIIGGKSYFA